MGNGNTKTYADPDITLNAIRTQAKNLQTVYTENIKLQSRPVRSAQGRSSQAGQQEDFGSEKRNNPIKQKEPVKSRRAPTPKQKDPVKSRRAPTPKQKEPVKSRRAPTPKQKEPVKSRRAPAKTVRKQKGGDATAPPVLNFNANAMNVCQHMDELKQRGLLNLPTEGSEGSEGSKQDKQNKAMCDAISNHFQERIALIKTITDGLFFCEELVKNFRNNGFCSNNDPKFDKERCNRSVKYQWQHVDDVITSNHEILAEIGKMKIRYNANLEKLMSILDSLKNDMSLNGTTLARMKTQVDNLIRNMNRKCNEMYVPITKHIIESSSAARLDALRYTQGLNDYIPNPAPKY
jgi:hypothetical protein